MLILGYSFWQRRFAGSAAAIGTQLVLDEKRYTVVGIAPAGFRLDGDEPDVFTPLGQDTAEYMQNRRAASGWRCGAPPARRDAGAGADGAGADRPPSG